jgi:small subunit ribosomal protein S15e
MSAEDADQLKKKRAFKKFTYRGIDLDKLLDMSTHEASVSHRF